MGDGRGTWADLERDLAEAAAAERRAARLGAELEEAAPGGMPPHVRDGLEKAVGYELHAVYGALEQALERLVLALDGDVPAGRSSHADLLRRACEPLQAPDGTALRPALLTAQTVAVMRRLMHFRHAFRRAYAGYAYERAKENLEVARGAVGAVAAEIRAAVTRAAAAPSREPGAREKR